MRVIKEFDADINNVSELVKFIGDNLEKYGIKSKDRAKAALAAEEAAVSLISHKSEVPTGESGKIRVDLRAFGGSVSAELSASGETFSFAVKDSAVPLDEWYDSERLEEFLRNRLLGGLTDSLKYTHRNGVNYIRMTVVRTKQAFLYQTLGALFAAIILGLIFASFMPESVNTFLNSNILVPIKTMYMNALKMIVGPVVFLSVISCISQFSDISALGRIGGKIIGMYILTTVLAVGVGIGVFCLIQPGDPSLASSLIADASAYTSQTVDVSLKDTIVGIVPSDVINPFLTLNMLQILFMAILFGVATSLLGKYSASLSEFFNALNELFLKVTMLIIKLIPLAVFCSIMSMMLTMGVHAILSVLGMFGTFLLGLVCMMLLYGVLMSAMGRVNPVPFFKRYAPTMLQVFAMASSNASIPVNMEACEKNGVSKRIYSISIPLGATLNMDGTSIYLAIFALALARIYGVGISSSAMVSLIISIIVLSMGAPGIPGSGLICLSVLLAQIHVPVEAVGLIMGIDALCGMFRSMSNCLGDVAVSLIVAKSEKELDLDIYRS